MGEHHRATGILKNTIKGQEAGAHTSRSTGEDTCQCEEEDTCARIQAGAPAAHDCMGLFEHTGYM